MDETKEIARRHIDREVLVRLVIFLVISVILILIAAYDVFEGVIALYLGVYAFAAGLLIGAITARMTKMYWHKKEKKIMSRFDLFGTLLLVAYLVFAYFRSTILGWWINGPQIGTFSLILIGGSLAGRFLSIAFKTRGLLREQNIIE